MDEPTSNPRRELTEDEWALIEPIVEEFVRDLRIDHQPNIDDFVERAESSVKDLVKEELVGEEFAHRFGDATIAGRLRYRPVSQIGIGTFGAVYKAWDNKLSRFVALKVLLRTDDAAKDRFLVEAHRQAKLNHPNLVPIHDIGELPKGHPFLVMEYIEGETLRERINTGQPFPLKVAALLVKRVAEAVAELHGANAKSTGELGSCSVHQDIKPENVLLDNLEEPHLADFGLLATVGNLHSSSEAIGGTIAYMSPEQVVGVRDGALRDPIDARSDVWALGVILYELLSGSRPFLSSHPDSETRNNELFEAILHCEPPLLQNLRLDAPTELQELVEDCLRKPIQSRLQSAKDVADRIQAWLDAKPATTKNSTHDIWETLTQHIMRECRDAWQSSSERKPTLSLDDAVTLFTDVLEFRIGSPHLDGLNEPVVAALRDSFDQSSDRGRLINAFKKLSELLEPYLAKILALADAEGHNRARPSGALSSLLQRCGLKGTTKRNDPFALAIRNAHSLRNKVHSAPEWSNRDISNGLVDVLVVYLIATDKFSNRLRAALANLPRLTRLSELRHRFRAVAHCAVTLSASETPENDLFLESTAVETSEYDESDSDYAAHTEFTDRDTSMASEVLRQGAVREIANDVPRFVLLGDPGAGKTTTLAHYAFVLASRLLDDPRRSCEFPLYVELRRCSVERPLLRLLAGEAGESVEEFIGDLQVGHWLLLLDGLNEIHTSYAEAVSRDLEDLLQSYPNIRVVLTSRRYGFHSRFPIPAFELLPLTDGQICEFLDRNFVPAEKAAAFARMLRQQPRLWRWVRNPMVLFMLSRVGSRSGGVLPTNRGQLMRLFVRSILERESEKLKQTDRDLKEYILGQVAFAMRQDGVVEFSQVAFLRKTKAVTESLGCEINTHAFLEEVLDNHLVTAQTDGLCFTHELYQEYFAAVALKERFNSEREAVLALAKETRWQEPIVLLHGLMEMPERLFTGVLKINLVLAANCITSQLQLNNNDVRQIVDACEEVNFATATEEKIAETFSAICSLGDTKRAIDVCEKLLTSPKSEERERGRWKGITKGLLQFEDLADFSRACLSHFQQKTFNTSLFPLVMVLFQSQQKRYGLDNREWLVGFVQSLIGLGEWRIAARYVLRFGLEQHFDVPQLIRAMIETRQDRHIDRWLWSLREVSGEVEHRLAKEGNRFGTRLNEKASQYAACQVVDGYCEIGRFDLAAKIVQKFKSRMSQDLITNTILRMARAGKTGMASKWYKKWGISDTEVERVLFSQTGSIGEIASDPIADSAGLQETPASNGPDAHERKSITIPEEPVSQTTDAMARRCSRRLMNLLKPGSRTTDAMAFIREIDRWLKKSAELPVGLDLEKVELRGSVKDVKSTFGWISVPGVRDFFVHTSECQGVPLSRLSGTAVRFNVGLRTNPKTDTVCLNAVNVRPID